MSNPVIRSLANTKVKHALKLREAGQRRAEGLFLIDGQNEINKAIAAQFEFQRLFVDESDHLSWLNSVDDHFGTEIVQPVDPAVLEKLAYGQRTSGPVAIAKTPSQRLRDLKLKEKPLLLVLDAIEKPGNLGACIRTALAAEADAIVLTNPICDVFNPNAIRASRGAIFQLPIAVSTREELQDFCRQLGIKLLAARVDGELDLWEADLKIATAIVFGNEAHGLGGDWTAANCTAFQIQMAPQVDSLNVSISAALALYEARRQRTKE